MPVRCAVFGCHNQSDQKDRWIVMPHVGDLSFHGCQENNYAIWTKLINRKDAGWAGVNKNTKVCSNHFKLGKPFPKSPHPILYMKGYANGELPKKGKYRKKLEVKPHKTRKRKNVADENLDHDGFVKRGNEVPDHSTSQADLFIEHSYNQQSFEACEKCSPFIHQLLETVSNMSQHIRHLENQLAETKVSAIKNEECVAATHKKKSE